MNPRAFPRGSPALQSLSRNKGTVVRGLIMAALLTGCATASVESSWPAHIVATETSEVGTHALNLFAGASLTESEEGVSVGLDYEYRVTDLFGVGAFVDVAGGDFRSVALGAAVYIHPIERVVLVVGPGFDVDGSDGAFLLRLGGFYEFPVGKAGKYVIAPAVYYDFVDGHENVIVIGVSFGVKF